MSFLVDVPNLPGVPPVFRSSVGSAVLSLLSADAASLIGGIFNFPKWGIYLDGIPVVVADTVVAFELDKSWQISNFPIEGGNFQSYNKVYNPFSGTFRFVSGGSLTNRQELLLSVDAISGDLNSYDIVTPEAVYAGVNVVDYSYRRTAHDGVGLLAVDVRVEQVRQTIGASLLHTIEAVSASLVNGGTVQGAAPSATQSAAAPAIAAARGK